MKRNSDRLFYLDLLRSLSIVGVVVMHTFNPYVDGFNEWTVVNQAISILIVNLFRFAVPMYVMVSGAILLNRNYDNLPEFYSKRFSKIIIPLFFWTIIFSLVRYLHNPASINAEYLISLFIFGQPFYLIYVMIGLYLISPLLRQIIIYLPNKSVNLICTISFIIASISSLTNYWLLADKNILPNYIYTQWLSYLGYYLSGYLIGQQLSEKISKLKPGLYFILAVAITIIANYVFTSKFGLNSKGFIWNQSLSPNIILMTISLFAWIKLIEGVKINLSITTLITNLSKSSYGIYFVHMLVISVFTTYINNINISTTSLSILTFFAVLSLSWLIVWGGQKINQHIMSLRHYNRNTKQF